MELYQITCPKTTRDCALRNDAEQFEAHICRIAGGFTSREAFGAWFNPKTGKVEREAVLQYDVAIAGADAAKAWRQIVDYARDFYRDQECLFVARLGSAEIVPAGGAAELELAEAA